MQIADSYLFEYYSEYRLFKYVTYDVKTITFSNVNDGYFPIK